MANAIVEQDYKQFWSRLGTGARTGLVAGLAVIAALAVGLTLWSTGSDYRVLFSQLTDGDAASIVEQLKRQKVPYRLVDGGATIEVPAEQVYETRLALVSSGVPLSGGVGFELFDRESVGATEESQRVTYQRALQGELARTIDALNGVKYARVHLVLPQPTVFKRDREEPRASVALIMKPGVSLGHDEVLGVQRLVAAAVEGLDSSKVVITDQRGITLSGADGSGGSTSTSEARLDLKREVEGYVARKIVALLDRAYGPGQALVSVDATLNLDQIQSTVQDVVPLHGVGTDAPEGAIVRKRQVETRAASSQTTSSGGAATDNARPGSATTEVEYEFGRRVEQVVRAPGGITRMSVGIVVPGTLDEAKRRKIADLVSVAAGLNPGRGDAVVVEPLDELAEAGASRAAHGNTSSGGETEDAPATATGAAPKALSRSQPGLSLPLWARIGTGVAVLLGLVLTGLYVGRGVRRAGGTLSVTERRQLLLELERTLAADSPQRVRGEA